MNNIPISDEHCLCGPHQLAGTELFLNSVGLAAASADRNRNLNPNLKLTDSHRSMAVDYRPNYLPLWKDVQFR